jgi:hypothetical protein
MWMLVDHGWPVGQYYLEEGTVIEDDLRNPQTGLLLPLPLPINAYSLTQSAYDQMRQWYGPELWHRLRYDPTVVKGKSAT